MRSKIGPVVKKLSYDTGIPVSQNVKNMFSKKRVFFDKLIIKNVQNELLYIKAKKTTAKFHKIFHLPGERGILI